MYEKDTPDIVTGYTSTSRTAPIVQLYISVAHKVGGLMIYFDHLEQQRLKQIKYQLGVEISLFFVLTFLKSLLVLEESLLFKVLGRLGMIITLKG